MTNLLISLAIVGCDYRVASYARTYANQATYAPQASYDYSNQIASYLQQAAAEQATNARLDRIEAALRALTPAPQPAPQPQPQPQPQVTVEYAPRPTYATPQYLPAPSAPAKSYPTPQYQPAPSKSPPTPQSQAPAPIGDAPPPPPVPGPGPAAAVLGNPAVTAMATVLRNRCAACHAGDAAQGGGIPLLDASGQVADDIASRFPAIVSALTSNRMPKGAPPLPAEEKIRVFGGLGILSTAVVSTASR